MKFELAAALLRRWGSSQDAANGSFRGALRAGGPAPASGEEGVDLLLSITIGLFVAACILLFERWLKDPSVEKTASEAVPRGASGHHLGERHLSRAGSKRGEFSRGLSSLIFGNVRQAADDEDVDHLTKEEVRDELLNLSYRDLLWTLQEVVSHRGSDVLAEAMRESAPRKSRRSSLGHFGLEERMETKETLRSTLPLLRFSSFQYYAEEGEELTVRVVRLGDVSRRSVVPYCTKDATAKAVVNYVPLKGSLTFEPGEHTKELQVQINENDFYGPSLELTLELAEDGMENARLDKDLWTARVEIMDNDFFPTNAYEGMIDPEHLVKDDSAIKRLDQTRLLWEFIRFCMVDSTIFWGMIKMVLVDQLENLYGFVNLIMTVYLVDYVVVASVPESSLFIGRNREVSLVVVTACLVVPVFALHLLNYMRNFWGVSGRARTTMQTALLRKFLDYSDDVRSEVQQSDIIMAVTTDSMELVDGGLLKTLVFIKQMGAVFMLVLFQVVAPIIFDRPFRLWLLGCVMLVPMCTSCVAKLRFSRSSTTLDQKYESALQLTTMVHETVVCYPLIADYNRRPVFVEGFGKLIKQHNQACINVGVVLANNNYLANWLTVLAVAVFTFFGGMLVIRGSMTLGIFLANIKIFRDVGDTCQEVYRVWLEMQQVLPPLIRITRLLNLPIDIDERKALCESREMRSLGELELVPSEDKAEAANTMPITMRDIRIRFYRSDKAINLSGRVEIHPGKLVAVVGPRGSGKSTFLKILGGAILPNPEDFFIPSHLTVLHVQPEAIFFSGTLMDNLLFGVNPPHDEAAKSRARRICWRLGIKGDVLQSMETNTALPWTSVLSISQKALINLARALIANPHVLLIHRPADYLDEDAQSATMSVLKEFVNKRGLEEDEVSFPIELRPPHTCVMTTASTACLQMADEVICLSKDSGIKNVPTEEAAAYMMG